MTRPLCFCFKCFLKFFLRCLERSEIYNFNRNVWNYMNILSFYSIFEMYCYLFYCTWIMFIIAAILSRHFLLVTQKALKFTLSTNQDHLEYLIDHHQKPLGLELFFFLSMEVIDMAKIWWIKCFKNFYISWIFKKIKNLTMLILWKFSKFSWK